MSYDEIRVRIRAVFRRIKESCQDYVQYKSFSPSPPLTRTDGDRGRLFLLVEFNYFCATRRELRRGQASTGTPSVRPAYLPNFSGPSLLPSRPLPHSSALLSLGSLRLAPSPTLLSAVVAAKVSFPLNLLRGRKHKGKKERTKLQKNPAERRRGR